MAHSSSIHPFSADPDFDYEIRCAIGNTSEGGGVPGEILTAVSSVRKGNHEGWYSAWWELAQRTLAVAHSSAAAGHKVSAAEAFLRASTYYGVAVNAVSALADDSKLASTFKLQEEAWNGFIANTDTQVEEVAIPYEDSELPGWFFRSTSPNGATLVAVNGSDGSRASMIASCVAPALRRGYNVLVFDGPGQQSQLFEQGVPFRYDWEHVLTPVYEFVSGLEAVDPAKIAVYGISQGSYWTTRALAFEHRFVAAVVDPGIVDVSTSWTSHLPSSLLKLLDEGKLEKFDKEMDFGMKFSPSTARTWNFRARPYGTKGYAETIEEVRKYTVADIADQVTTPLLILSPEGEQFWPGQSEKLAELTGEVSTVVPFTAAEGASEHCEPLARSLVAQRMYGWLDEKIG